MNIIGIAGIALMASILAVMLRRYHQEYAMILSIAAGMLILFQIFANVFPAVREISSLLSASGLASGYSAILFKAIGICFLTQFASDSCRDAGENALASKVELAGKIAIVVLSLPLFTTIARTALGLIGE